MTSGNGYSLIGGGKFETTSFTLKIIAIVAMTMNHAANIFYDVLPLPALCVLFGAGGLTFPIMAFLLVVGYRHTSNIKKYAFRLGVFALISQIPFSLFLAPTGNVLVTLLISLGVLYADDQMRNRAAFWAVFAIAAVGSLACDWGFLGVVIVYLFKTMYGQRGGIAVPVVIAILALGLPLLSNLVANVIAAGDWYYLPQVLYPFVGCALVVPLLSDYRGRRGYPLKWFFYAYYPAHIAVLGIAYVLAFGAMPYF
ncbi:TraX family protein [Gordonibacter sp.]|uniref:TraX family protein n=1 Tax=Gordonibacter sp. TaxID=1968902 RepID=UPI002FC8D2C5